MAGIVVVAALLPWLARTRGPRRQRARAKLRLAGIAAAVTAVVASPQLIAMAQQAMAGDASVSQGALAADYANSGAALQQIFAPSPRVGAFGLKSLAAYYYSQARTAPRSSPTAWC